MSDAPARPEPDTPAQAPLAIVGIGAMFPKADGLGAYWQNLQKGVDAITDVPATHWKADDYLDADPKARDMLYAARGGFLDPVDFDPMEFGIAPNDLEATDTSQLLGLVAAKRALADAGYGDGGKPLNRDRTSVILGVTGTLELVIPLGARLGHPLWRKALREAGVPDEVSDDVVERISDGYVDWQESSFPGLLGNVVAGRIASRLDLHGTNCVVDAACASSLSALHLASMELQSGRADTVVTGGVDTFNDVFMYMCFSKTTALSPTGSAKAFDKKADGTVLGEGVGIVVLKRLADAERDGDRIYAVLKGMGTSSDGKGNAIYAPSPAGQARALRKAYAAADVSPSTVELVEAHGTGTKVGDTVEASALDEVYRDSGREGRWAALGSVKSQIGHTKAAAGVAGLIKSVMALYHKVLPPTVRVDEPIDPITGVASPFYLPTEKRPWMARAEHPRRAGLSAFGFGGSNFHAVLEEYATEKPGIDWDPDVELLPLQGQAVRDLLTQVEDLPVNLPWPELQRRAALAREKFDVLAPCRLVLVIERGRTDVTKLFANTAAMLRANPQSRSWSTPYGAHFGQGQLLGKLAMLFPGQGSQYVGMLRDLACRFPVVQNVLEKADVAYELAAGGVVGGVTVGLHLSDRIFPYPEFNAAMREKAEWLLRDTRVAQPSIGAVSLGALAVLASVFGVGSTAFAGHSYGELAALEAGGSFDAETLQHLSILRGQLMAAGDGDLGSMLAVRADRDSAVLLLEDGDLKLSIANHNAPEQVVLSGETSEIERAVALCAERGIPAKQLAVAAAFHSALVAGAAEPMRKALDEAAIGVPVVPVYANASAEPYPDDVDAVRDLLARQIASPVEFVRLIERMYADGVRTFVEVGPGVTLTRLVGAILEGQEHAACAVDASRGRNTGMADLATCLAQIAVQGHSVDLARWNEGVAQPEPERRRWTIPITGANHKKPRPERPPLPTVRHETELAHASPTPAQPVAVTSTLPPGAARTVPPAPEAAMPRSPSDLPPPALAAPGVPTPPPRVAAAGADALASVREQMAALLRLQEQTASLHRRFLESQEAAQRTVEDLLDQQRALLGLAAPTTRSRSAAADELGRATAGGAAPDRGQAAQLPTTRMQGNVVDEMASGSPIRPRAGAEATDETASGSPIRPRAGADETGSAAESSSTAAAREHRLAPPSGRAPVDLSAVLLEVVAEKTGYPTDMLELSMEMDADLGIDSIKRVEILAAMQERTPGLPAVESDVLGRLRTLRDVVTVLNAPTSRAADGGATTRSRAAAVATDETASGSPIRPRAGADEAFSAAESSSTAAAREHRLAPPSGREPVDLSAVLLAVVAEKTGYPTDMLELSMEMDADLGIDSIKRVEILAAMQERLPGLPAVESDVLGRLRTLADVVKILNAPTSAAADDGAETRSRAAAVHELAAAEPVSSAPARGRIGDPEALSSIPVDLSAVLLEVVAEKTGYPTDMLELSMEMDADLGIDSIKRVEILAAMQERTPGLPAVESDVLGRLRTLADVVAILTAPTSAAPDDGAETRSRAAAVNELAAAETVSSAPARGRTGDPEAVSSTPSAPARGRIGDPEAVSSTVDRRVLSPFVIDGDPRERVDVTPGEILVAGDTDGLGAALARALVDTGHPARSVSVDSVGDLPSPLAGVVLVASSDGGNGAFLRSALALVTRASTALRATPGALLATVSRLDGAFGLADLNGADPASGGLAGIAKTAAHEWPDVVCKALDIPAHVNDVDAAARAVVDEILLRGPVEVGLSGKERVALRLDAQPVPASGEAPLAAGDLVVITGGARGVTAEAAVSFAAAFRPALLLLGRSPEPDDEPDWLAELDTEAEIKRALATRMNGSGSLKAVEVEYRRIAGVRAIRETLARCTAAGATATYRSVDVRDRDAVSAVIADARAEHGPVRGIVHGAGVLRDALIEQKTSEQFDDVYGTKVDGLRALLAALGEDDLRALVLFSSSTGRFGRVGQVDYAVANEVLNKIAQRERRRRPACRVVSVNWGPWAGGMVTDAHQRLFAEEGIGLIGLRVGADYLVQELLAGVDAPVEVVVLGQGSRAPRAPVVATSAPSTSLPLAFERVVSADTHPVLRSHVLDGRPVVPVVLMLQWMGHGALHANPGLRYHGVDGFRMLHGVPLQDGAATVAVHAGAVERRDGVFVVPTELRGLDAKGRERLLAKADVVLADRIGKSDDVAAFRPDDAPCADDRRTIYDEQLFHGPGLQGIRSVPHLSADGVVVDSDTAPAPAVWVRDPLRGTWLGDPLAIDVAFQALVVWTRAHRGAPSLPTGFTSYRQFAASFPMEGVRVSARVTSASEHAAHADIDFTAADGTLVARMTGYECVIDASLEGAYKKRTLAGAARG